MVSKNRVVISMKIITRRFVSVLRYDEINKAISKLLKKYADSLDETSHTKFLTPSIFSNILEK